MIQQLQSLPLLPQTVPPQPSLLPPQNNKRRIMIQQLLPPQLEKHPMLESSEFYLQCYIMLAGLSCFLLFKNLVEKNWAGWYDEAVVFHRNFTQYTKSVREYRVKWEGQNIWRITS